MLRGRQLEPPRLEPLRFYWRLLTWPAGQPEERHSTQLGGLLAVTQLANAAGFLAELARLGLRRT